MALKPTRRRSTFVGFVLPVLLLISALAGVLALALMAASTHAARHAQALVARRQAFEAAENAINRALQSVITQPPPWESQFEDEDDVRVTVTASLLGHWPAAPTQDDLPATEESHERISVTATTLRGARIRLEQDYVRPAVDAAAAMPSLRRTTWRELVPEDAT